MKSNLAKHSFNGSSGTSMSRTSPSFHGYYKDYESTSECSVFRADGDILDQHNHEFWIIDPEKEYFKKSSFYNDSISPLPPEIKYIPVALLSLNQSESTLIKIAPNQANEPILD